MLSVPLRARIQGRRFCLFGAVHERMAVLSLVLQQVAALKKQLDKETHLKVVRQTWRCTSRLIQTA